MIEKKRVHRGEPKRRRVAVVRSSARLVFASLTSILGKIGIYGCGVQPRDGHSDGRSRSIMSWLMVFVTGNRRAGAQDPEKRAGLHLPVADLPRGGSWLVLLQSACRMGRPASSSPIDKLSILVTILFSYLVFHEKLSKKAAVGLILVVGGTLLMLF